MAAVAEKLGQPFMPWQRLVADVGGEIDPLTGLPAYREVRVTVPRQSGKALGWDTEILTANRGWVLMADLRVGDEVFHPGGHSTRVTFTSDIMLGYECYRVTTVDGRSVVADAEHLWSVTDKRAERERILTTRQMKDSGLSRYARGSRVSVTNGKMYATSENRYALPGQEPIKSPDVDLPLDPYLLGAWCGDGNSANAALTTHVDEVPHWCSMILAAGYIPTPRHDSGKPNTWTVGITVALGPGRKKRAFGARLRALGVLGDKHVPALYLTAGTRQREALLQGLLDTDGCIDKARGQVEFCSMNRRLAEAVLFLARSLGWRATIRAGRAKLNGRDYGPKHRVSFTPKRSDPFIPFRLARKVARIQERDGGKGRNTLSVASIEPVSPVPVRCIKVESPDGLFLAGRDLIPTHNTTLFLSWQINRCVSRRWRHPQRSAFTAQTGKDARDKWIDELFPLIRNSGLKSLVASKGVRLEINEGMGNESIRFKTGSLIRLLSTATTSGHSKTLHQAVMDEVWHDSDDRREQGLRPAMITVPDAQLLVCSTAGTEASVVLNRKVETGRAAVLADVGVGVAYFEWSAPDDWDATDEASYFTFMPALCPDPPCRCSGDRSWRHTITSLDAIRAERDAMDLPEFRRAYGNIKTGNKDLRWQVVSEADWLAIQDLGSQAKDPLVFAIDTTPDRSHAHSSIAAVGMRPDGDLHGEVVDHAPGTTWVVARALELHTRWNPARWVVDAGGAAGFLIPQLEAAGVPVDPMTSRHVGQAYGMFRSAVSSDERGEVAESSAALTGAPGEGIAEEYVVPGIKIFPGRHGGALTTAVEGAATRRIGDGTTWDRKSTSTIISPLVALTNAVFGFVTMERVGESEPLVAWR